MNKKKVSFTDALPVKTRIQVKVEEGAKKIIIPPAKITAILWGTLFPCLFFVYLYLDYLLNVYYGYHWKITYFLENPFDPRDPFADPWYTLLIFVGLVLVVLALAYVRERNSEIFHLQASGMTYRINGKTVSFSIEHLQNLTLRKRPDGNRLFIHDGNKQIELAPNVSSLEREWLYGQMVQKYSLLQAKAVQV